MVYAGGSFTSVGGQHRVGIARFSSPTVLGEPLNATSDPTVWAMARQPNGGLIVGGKFIEADGQRRLYILRITAQGTLDPAWKPEFPNEVYGLATDVAGDVFAVGMELTVTAFYKSGLRRVNGSGVGADLNFPFVYFSPEYAVAMDAAGSVYVNGLSGIERYRLNETQQYVYDGN